jgi:pimeloyl-ACP methyl ester carboxylesterase
MSVREITAKHSDGRAVHALVLGEPNCGKVVVYHHGFPASRLEALLARKCTTELGICIVSIDRPGIGGSIGYDGRKLADWPHDVALIMDTIGVREFAVLGVSGGTPSAVTLAARLPERVRSLTVVSGLAPMHLSGALSGANVINKAVMRIGYSRPLLARRTVRGIAHLWSKVPVIPHLWLAALLPKCDKDIVSNKMVAGIMAKSVTEAFKQGIDGVVTEFELMTTAWEAELEEVKVPTVIWHGMNDTYVPFAMGSILHERIKGSAFHQIPDAGHFMIVPKLREILSELVSSAWSGREVGAA